MHLLIFLNHLLLLQTLNCNYSPSLDFFAQPDLPKSSSSNNFDGLKIFLAYFLSFSSTLLHFFVENLVFDEGFLRWRQLHIFQTLGEAFPVFGPFFCFDMVHAIFFFDVSFGCLCLFSNVFGYFCLVFLHAFSYYSY